MTFEIETIFSTVSVDCSFLFNTTTVERRPRGNKVSVMMRDGATAIVSNIVMAFSTVCPRESRSHERWIVRLSLQISNFGTLLSCCRSSTPRSNRRIPFLKSRKHLRHSIAPAGTVDKTSHNDCRPKHQFNTCWMRCRSPTKIPPWAGGILGRRPYRSQSLPKSVHGTRVGAHRSQPSLKERARLLGSAPTTVQTAQHFSSVPRGKSLTAFAERACSFLKRPLF